MSSSTRPSGHWVVLKPFDVLNTGDEFFELKWSCTPVEASGLYEGPCVCHFFFYRKGRDPVVVETVDLHLVHDNYVCWIGPEIVGIHNEALCSILQRICSSPFECKKEDVDFLYALAPFEIKAWEYLIGHKPVRRYLVDLAIRSKPTALTFFTALHHEKSNPWPSKTLEVLAALGSGLALPLVIENLKQKNPVVRRRAYEMLELLEGPEVNVLLQVGLRDANWNIQKFVDALIKKRKINN